MIAAWSDFWVAFVYGGVAVFAVMSLWVIVGGFFDIRRMFRDLRDTNSRDEPS